MGLFAAIQGKTTAIAREQPTDSCELNFILIKPWQALSTLSGE